MKEESTKFCNEFYQSEITKIMPESILDFHTHSWRREQWAGAKLANPEVKDSASLLKSNQGQYMAVEVDYSIEDLLYDAVSIFPDKKYHAVVFGQPTPVAVSPDVTNEYLSSYPKKDALFPLMVAGKDMKGKQELKDEIRRGSFFGYKVFLNWIGDDYGNIMVEDMIGDSEMSLADEMKLVVLLHVPGSGRLADKRISSGVRKLSLSYPNASIVLAHCGRCYTPKEMLQAVGSIKDLNNVYLDTSMVMDPMILHVLFSSINSERILFATDFPVAAMKGRRVYASDHWVDIVLKGYSESKFRLSSDHFRATYMAHEIAAAIGIAAETSGISDKQLSDVFYNNGIAVLKKVNRTK